MAGRSRIEHQVFQPGALQGGGQLGQLIKAGALDYQRRAGRLGRLGHSLPIGFVGRIQQRTRPRGGLQPGLGQRRIGGDQDERLLAGRTGGLHRRGKHCGVAGGGLHGKAVQCQGDADVVGQIGIRLGHGGLDGLLAGRVFHSHEQTRAMVESLLVAEEHGLIAHRQLAILAVDFHQPHGRRGSSFQFGFGGFRDMWAGLEFGLLGGQLHGEGQAGGEAAVLAVGLRQQLVDLESGECHASPR